MKNYGELNDKEKLKAILACIKEPMSIELILEFVGPNDLSEEDIREVTSSLNLENVEGRIWIKPDKQQEALTELNVDGKTVHGQIVKVMLDNPPAGLEDLFNSLK